jgi:hypothetical protein
MDQSVKRTNPLLKWWTWQSVLVATVVVFALLEVGTYAFNWTWTGFQANATLWDWLQLLLLPLALAVVPIWLTAQEEQRRRWLIQLRWTLSVTVAVFVLLFVGTFAFNWTWTGFGDHGRLWDWLSLLVVPILVAALPLWYSSQHHETREQQPSQNTPETNV